MASRVILRRSVVERATKDLSVRARERGLLLLALLTAGLLALSSPGYAQEGERPIIRARIDTPSPVMVGETVTLSVDVLTPTWFPRAPAFPAALDVENAVAVFDDTFRVNLSERLGSNTWSGIRRHYLIHPQLAGTYTVPPIEIEVVYALPNAKPSDPVTVTGPELRFEARVPPEAAGLGYFVSARGFALDQTVEPKAEGLRVGDAVTRTVTLSATDSSSMMLPITDFPPIEGLAVYPDPTRASDRGGERGSAREATRVDRVTYVLETEGEYTLPEVRISWWDVDAGRLREASAPAVSFAVAPNPDLGAEIALPEEPEDAEGPPAGAGPDWREWLSRGLAVVGALAVVAGLGRRFGRALADRAAAARRRKRKSEEAYFGKVLAACRANDAPGTMRALLAWVDRMTPPGERPTLRRLVALAGDAELTREVGELEKDLYGEGNPAGWRGDRLAQALERVRRAGGAAGDVHAEALLAPLNPPA